MDVGRGVKPPLWNKPQVPALTRSNTSRIDVITDKALIKSMPFDNSKEPGTPLGSYRFTGGTSACWEDISMEPTRRHALAGAAAIAAAPLLPSMPVKAAAPLADKQAPSFYRYKVGDIQVTVVSDGRSTVPLEDSFVTNAKKEEVSAALEKAFLPRDIFTIYYAPLVINTGGKLVVIDTGNGAVANVNSKGANGQFAANMAASGLDAKAVDMVVISHFHTDHVGGLLAADGTPAFPNAEVLVPATEWKFWMDDGEMSRAPAGRMQNLFKNNRNIFDAGLKRKVTPYEWGKEVAPGLLAVETAGHTPGHTSYVLSSGSGKVFIQSDVTNNPNPFAANPGWHAFFDQDGDVAEKTRRRVYDMVAAEKLQVQGFHYPFPGLGHVEKDGSGYRVIPTPWNPTT
jgi:glyoxylase-like metal-dependent hydrolase (beta-lactamase superfamily II)